MKMHFLITALILGVIVQANGQSVYPLRIFEPQELSSCLLTIASSQLPAPSRANGRIIVSTASQTPLVYHMRLNVSVDVATKAINPLEKLPYIDMEDIIATLPGSFQLRYGSAVRFSGGR